MQERRQNWHKFERVLGYLPSKRQGLLVLTNEQKILGGAVSEAYGQTNVQKFKEEESAFDHVESAQEVLGHRYNASHVTFLDRNELLQTLSKLTSKTGVDSYYTQLSSLREAMRIDTGEKTKLATHLGDKPVQDFFPREHFFLQAFDAMFSELLPEKKILLLGIINSENERDFLVLEFTGQRLVATSRPNWHELEWTQEKFDCFERNTAARLVLWCENHYLLPTYAVFFDADAWQECCLLQEREGEKAAWRYLVKTKQTKDAEKQILVEPEPWPLKACFHWNSMR